MKIIDYTENSVEFVQLKVGDCFMYDRCLFLKINPIIEKGYNTAANAVCFSTNNITHVPQSMIVTPVDAELIIKWKGDV